jgi:serine/threonine protein kinase
VAQEPEACAAAGRAGRIIAPLLDALEVVHGGNFLHRDIAPDNIIIRKDGSPVLIDFGSARGEIASHSRTVSLAPG